MMATSTTSTIPAVVGRPACATFASATPRLPCAGADHLDRTDRPGPTTNGQLLGRLEVSLQEHVHAPDAVLVELNAVGRTARSTLRRERATP